MAIDLRRIHPLGLALGGGGALGAAHVGVLRVLQERRITPDLVVGTSAGAIIGGAYAAGMTVDEIERTVLGSRWGDFGTFSLTPGIGLLDTAGLRATIEAIAGSDLMIEDLPVRFATVATDVSTRSAVLIDSGSLADAIAASISVPGIFRPARVGGRVLVDGGVVQNLPLEAAFSMGAAHVIGVRIAAEWDVLPSLRSSVNVHEWEIRSDVTMVRPALAHRSQWIPKDLPALVELGRQAASAAIPAPPLPWHQRIGATVRSTVRSAVRSMVRPRHDATSLGSGTPSPPL